MRGERAHGRRAPTVGLCRRAHGGGEGTAQGVPLRARYWLAAATLAEPHCWDEGVRWVSDGFGGGRCGGCPPAQGRAVGPTVKKGRSPWGRRGFADPSPDPQLFAGQGAQGRSCSRPGAAGGRPRPQASIWTGVGEEGLVVRAWRGDGRGDSVSLRGDRGCRGAGCCRRR